MDLDPQIAKTIVSNLKDIIHHEINLFDTTGVIVASTDKSRIGTGHDGARLAIKTRQNVVIDINNEYKGAKHGINVPVLFNKSVCAVIGITGEPSEVEPFGNVIKKMTEILIRENYEQIGRFEERERFTSLCNSLILRRHDQEFTSYLASVLHIDLERPRMVVVGNINNAADPDTTMESLYGSLLLRFNPLKHSFFSLTAREICMFIDEQDVYQLNTLIKGIQAEAERSLKHRLYIGIGSIVAESKHYWRSFDQASRTVKWLRYSGENLTASFEDLDYGAVISSVSTDEIDHLTERVFGSLTDKEIDNFQHIFDAYTRHNGSIVHCAEELYLHKNTLQNHLNRIAKKTGYNPRVLEDYAVLSLAFKLRDYERFCASHPAAFIEPTAGQSLGAGLTSA